DLVPRGLRGAAFGLRQSLDTVGAFLGPLIAVGLMLLWSNDFRGIHGRRDSGASVLARASVRRSGTAARRDAEAAQPDPPRESRATGWCVLVDRRRRRCLHACAVQRGVPRVA